MIYATKRRGYRGGNYNTPLVDPFLASVQAFQPEILDDYEIGAKLRWGVGQVRGTLNIAGFTGKDKDRQIPVGSSNLGGGTCIPEAVGSAGRPANCATTARQSAYPVGTPGLLVRYGVATTVANGGSITIRGFEVDGTVTPVNGFTIGGGLAYVDTKVNNVSFDPNFLALLTAANQQVPTTIDIDQQPKWMGNANVTINIPGKILAGDLSLNVDMKYSDKFKVGSTAVQAYTTLDGRITLADIGDTGLDVAFWGRNLLNENYNYGTSASGPATTGVLSFIHAPPRTVGLSVRYQFGN